MVKIFLSVMLSLSNAVFGAAAAAPDHTSSDYLTLTEQAAQNKYPETFDGHDKFSGFDIGLLKSVFGPENAMQHMRLQERYLDILTQYAEQLPNSNSKTAVLATLHATRALGVDGYIESGNELLVLRVLAAAREERLSDDEFALFEQVPGSKVIFALYQEVPDGLPSLVKTVAGQDIDDLFLRQRRFAWQHSNMAINYFLEQPETPGKNKHYYSDTARIGQKGNTLLSKEFEKHFGEKKVYWPMPYTGKIGLSLLVKALLDDIMILPLPVPDPSSITKAHGIKVTPLGMAFHDYLHGNFDTRRQQLWSWCILEINKKIEVAQRAEQTQGANGGAASAVVPDVTVERYDIMIPRIVQEASDRYKAVIKQFKLVYNYALKELNRTNGLTPEKKQAYNRFIVPIYLIFHEAYVFDKAWLDAPESSVQLAVDFAKEFFEEDLSKVVQYTLDIPDDQIINSVIDTEIIDKGSSVYKGLPYKITRPKVLLDDCSIRRNPMNTIVTIATVDGDELIYAYPTLDNIERDLKDHVSLLKLCGYIDSYEINTKIPLFGQRDKIKAATMQLFDGFLIAVNAKTVIARREAEAATATE